MKILCTVGQCLVGCLRDAGPNSITRRKVVLASGSPNVSRVAKNIFHAKAQGCKGYDINLWTVIQYWPCCSLDWHNRTQSLAARRQVKMYLVLGVLYALQIQGH